MFEYFHKLPQMYQGIISLIIGTVLLLHVMGVVIFGIKIVILVFAIYLLSAGMVRSGLYEKIIETLHHMKSKHKK
jgi:hypothetical protein